MISVRAAIIEAMSVHMDNELPNEACGLLAGTGGRVEFFYPLTNSDPGPATYTVDPAEHLGALRHAERNGWSLVGVWHSHPTGPARPSARDVAHALEPDWLYVISGTDGLAAWTIRQRLVEPVPITLAR